MGQYKSQYTGPQIDAGVDAALNPDVTVTPDSDALVTSGAVADALDNIDPTITGNTDTTLNGILVGDGGKVGTKSLDTSSLTNDADHVPVSSVVKSALNTVDESIAIRVSGNKTTYASGAAIGQYVIVDSSTITGITDGLYKAAKAIPYNTVIDSTYLTAVSGGGLNDLKAAIKPLWIWNGSTQAAGRAAIWDAGQGTANTIVILIQIQNTDGNWYSFTQGSANGFSVAYDPTNRVPVLYLPAETDSSWCNRPCRAIMWM